MSESIPEKGVCRIVTVNVDKDLNWLDVESDADECEVMSVEDSDKHKKHERSEHRKGLKRKRHKEDSMKSRCYASQRKQIEENCKTRPFLSNRKVSKTNLMPVAVRRLKTQFKAICLLEGHDTVIRRYASDQKEAEKAIDSIANEDTAMNLITSHQREVEERTTGFSQSYLQMTDAVRRLTEGLHLLRNQDSTRDRNTLRQQESEERYTTGRDELPLISSPQDMLISHDNKEYVRHSQARITEPLKAVKNPLRLFRLRRNKDGTRGNIEASQALLKVSNTFFDAHLDDAINVKMAAEALSLLKNKGKFSTHIPAEEYFKTGHPSSVQISDAAICIASRTCEDLNNTRTSLYTGWPAKDTEGKNILSSNLYSCNKVEQRRHSTFFDSTLEITDTTTGAKIPVESLYLQSNENCSNEQNEFRQILDVREQISVQLSDSVICSKVPLAKAGFTTRRTEH